MVIEWDEESVKYPGSLRRESSITLNSLRRTSSTTMTT